MAPLFVDLPAVQKRCQPLRVSCSYSCVITDASLFRVHQLNPRPIENAPEDLVYPGAAFSGNDGFVGRSTSKFSPRMSGTFFIATISPVKCSSEPADQPGKHAVFIELELDQADDKKKLTEPPQDD